MADPARDTERAIAAAKVIYDNRLVAQSSEIMVTLEQTIACVLLGLYGDPAKAASMLNEGLVQGVEDRLALYNARKR